MKFPQTFPGAEPFFLSGSRCGCLLVHGFTGTPKEMRWMGENLHSQGYTVLGIRLSGHAAHNFIQSRVNSSAGERTHAA